MIGQHTVLHQHVCDPAADRSLSGTWKDTKWSEFIPVIHAPSTCIESDGHAGLKTHLVTEHVAHVFLFQDFPPPVAFQHSVLDDDGHSSQDEGQEEIAVNVVSCTMQLPVRHTSIQHIFIQLTWSSSLIVVCFFLSYFMCNFPPTNVFLFMHLSVVNQVEFPSAELWCTHELR